MCFEEGMEEMRPDEYMYTTAIAVVGKSGQAGAAQRAEAIPQANGGALQGR